MSLVGSVSAKPAAWASRKASAKGFCRCPLPVTLHLKLQTGPQVVRTCSTFAFATSTLAAMRLKQSARMSVPGDGSKVPMRLKKTARMSVPGNGSNKRKRQSLHPEGGAAKRAHPEPLETADVAPLPAVRSHNGAHITTLSLIQIARFPLCS